MNWTLHCGSALDVLRTLPEASANCIVSSPPYWGLRDYGTARWEGGDTTCEHALKTKPRNDTTGSGENKGRFSDSRGQQPSKAASIDPRQDKSVCGYCGAARVDDQIGLERTPDAFVRALVEVFAEARRVLRPDGVCWVNMGDCYATGAGKVGDHLGGGDQGARWKGDTAGGHRGSRGDSAKQPNTGAAVGPLTQPNRLPLPGLKPKDLIGVPWMLAFALRADGWYLRADVVWSKPNPMPESIKDRPTKAHESVFLLTKSERYTYDQDAIREKYAASTMKEFGQPYEAEGRKDYDAAGVQNPSSVKARIVTKARSVRQGIDHKGGNQGNGVMTFGAQSGANARSVWTIPTEPSPYEHFAVMPKALARKCIMAGCPPGGVVLDPFAGVCTTGVVALEEGRSFVGIELNPKYHAMGRERLAGVAPLLATEIPA